MMWNLTADDVQRAKQELKGRRAAIQARYENELKQLEVDIADLETFERFAVKFVSDFKGGETPTAEAAEPPATVEAPPAAVNVAAEPDNPPVVTDVSSEKVEAAGGVDAGVRKGTSRWRMHLGASEASA
jgi:hypothetical protein